MTSLRAGQPVVDAIWSCRSSVELSMCMRSWVPTFAGCPTTPPGAKSLPATLNTSFLSRAGLSPSASHGATHGGARNARPAQSSPGSSRAEPGHGAVPDGSRNARPAQDRRVGWRPLASTPLRYVPCQGFPQSRTSGEQVLISGNSFAYFGEDPSGGREGTRTPDLSRVRRAL
jgi:hypothetical protein